MILQTTLSAPALFSSCSAHRLHPLLFSKRRRFSYWHFNRLRPRLFTVAASENGVFTSPETAKSFDFTSEERIYSWWEAQGYFRPNFDRGSDPFVISMPPPNVTGSLHMGHAMFVTLEDIMVRYHRMKGRPTLWLPGTDHAGIATQLVVERMLASEGIKRVDLGRDEFVKRVWEWKEKYGGTITNQIKRLGASCDWNREHFTLDEQLSRAVVEAFVRLHEKGLIYQGSYMVNWSPSLQTAVSDLEVEYHEESGSLYYIKYRVAGGSKTDFLTIATTRLETLFGDVAIAVHPEDDRYSKYINRMAIVPMTYGRHVPIISDKHVDKEFGTGVLKISPGHDHNDYNLAKKLGLPILNVMNKDGTLNKVAGLYCGLDRSQRGGEVIEPLVSKQWFVTMEPLAEKALHAVEKGDLKIIPERFENVWYIVGKDCEEEYIVARSYDEALGKALENALWPFSTLGWPDVSTEDFRQFYPTSMLETGHDILFFWVARMVMMGIEFTGTVPFSHIYLHGLIRDPEIDESINHVCCILDDMGVVDFYFAPDYSQLAGAKDVKTLGNVIDPLDTIKEYGTDALRFTLALGTAGQDLNLSMERLTSNKAFTNKLWNAGKFVLQNLPSQNDASVWENILSYKFDKEELLDILPLPEHWVISKLHLLIDTVTASYDKFFFGDVGRETYNFFWGDFADWYIEARKARLPNLALIRAIRNARAEYSVEPVKRISASIVANVEVTEYIMKEKVVLALLSRLELQSIHFTDSPPGNADQSVHLVAGEGLEAYLPLADMTEYDGLIARLSSPKFVEKAPEDIVPLLESTALVT
ncbi:hypothetical protein M0R45_006489 [Rubus argutus]|uniref:valine--tRNA ligase n=1 Tax=Rubus argutus TaxID=59490 RepID=A0AAW1YQS6_RUBAR